MESNPQVVVGCPAKASDWKRFRFDSYALRQILRNARGGVTYLKGKRNLSLLLCS